MEKIKLQVDEKNLVNHLLKNSFTNRDTYISELMQNARRSGASAVWFHYDPDCETLTVTDDGSGIRDFDKLLHLAQTGWDEKTRQTESPFGVGFFAAIFASEHLQVDSNGKRIAFSPQEVTSFEDIWVEDAPHRSGTRIVMKSVPENADYAVKCAARGFGIPVYLNNELVERKHAPDGGLHFISTDIGMIALEGIGSLDGIGTLYSTLYLQGIRVMKANRTPCNIVHLDPTKFRSRMPDRDTLIDEAVVVEQVESIIKQLWRRHLYDLKKNMDPRKFADHCYKATSEWGCMELWDKVDYLPRGALDFIPDYPIHEPWSSILRNVDESIPRSDIIEGKVKLVSHNVSIGFEESATEAMYVYLLGSMLIKAEFSQDHWVWQYAQNLYDDSMNSLVTVHADGVTGMAHYGGNWISGEAMLCEAYTLKGPHGDATSKDDAVYTAGDKVHHKQGDTEIYFLVPNREITGNVVRQAAEFIGEFEDYLEHEMEEERRQFESFISLQRSDCMADIVADELRGMRYKPFGAIRNKAFTVVFDDYLNASVTQRRLPINVVAVRLLKKLQGLLRKTGLVYTNQSP